MEEDKGSKQTTKNGICELFSDRNLHVCEQLKLSVNDVSWKLSISALWWGRCWITQLKHRRKTYSNKISNLASYGIKLFQWMQLYNLMVKHHKFRKWL